MGTDVGIERPAGTAPHRGLVAGELKERGGDAMCGRFVQAERPETYAEYFSVDDVRVDALPASWNIAPTDRVYAIAEHGDRRQLGAFSWGLLPWWAKDRKMAARTINARAESIATKPAFRDSFIEKRCIIPADGFYEWERKDRGKLPHFIAAAKGEPLALAGLWSSWRDPETEERVRTCTIVTGEPNTLVAPLHDRMPVVLPKTAWDPWLDPEVRDADLLQSLLTTAPAADMVEHPVSTLVNKVANNIPELITPLDSGAVS
jgi:putative SOS response-associated peptidase YedK